nr:MAG TPA: hypothetical protein [Caudoviricetes sp.]
MEIVVELFRKLRKVSMSLSVNLSYGIIIKGIFFISQ